MSQLTGVSRRPGPSPMAECARALASARRGEITSQELQILLEEQVSTGEMTPRQVLQLEKPIEGQLGNPTFESLLDISAATTGQASSV